ncbi:DUF2254 family protein [Sandaracinus amylolyticus]|uniref:DUF2254 family protein n=1 Tax=Sandaracinus amylolyticus TaxID=927083 RepID=UPI001F164BDE|nr:DUF2254 family protein [Sandaracinus amylolyticus]UJR86593.1 Hypothetical protein I5071_86940 [Sandaracinus amylolyticus]
MGSDTNGARPAHERPNGLRRGALSWAMPFVVLTGAAIFVFATLYYFDHVLFGSAAPDANSAVHRFVDFDPHTITDAISSLAGNIATVFGIVVTVVSIIVQLSAERYTGVARMFLRDRVNLAVMGFYVIVCVMGVWTAFTLKSEFVPRGTLLAMMGMTTIGLVLMAPYFGYVFWFLEPMNIIRRIRRDAIRTATEGSESADTDFSSRLQSATLNAMEELTDITSNSISGKDKIIASGAVDALKDFTLAYLKLKSRASDAWFALGSGLKQNPDFVAMDPESLGDLETRRTWVEWKVMRQYLGIYNEALGSMRDINYLVAIDTRYIGEAASQAKDEELIRLVYRFMNSYLRATLNARDVRTAYNVLNQYRKLVEALLRDGNGEAAREGVRHMTYYGHVSFDMKLPFVTETVAYDVSAICQMAHEQEAPEQDAMLEQFLELDRPLRSQAQESALLGVRKAQVKLAAYYLWKSQRDKAHLIADDMRNEPRARLDQIRTSLEGVTTKDFWEIIDRGRNFEYMPPEQRSQMSTFFGWLEEERKTMVGGA